MTTGPLALSLSTSDAAVCAFGFSTCADAPATVRLHLSVAAPAPQSGNQSPVQVLYLLDVSPFTQGYTCAESDGCYVGTTALEETFLGSAGRIASTLAGDHPGTNLSFAFAVTDATGGPFDDGDGAMLSTPVGNFTNASLFGGAVNKSFQLVSDVDFGDNPLQTGAITALYGAFTGQRGSFFGAYNSPANWQAGSNHVVVWMGAAAPLDSNYSETICPLAPFGCAGTSNGSLTTCQNSPNFSGGPMPSCEGWINSQNGNPHDSIAALAYAGAGCVNSSNGHCTVDSIVVNATPSNPGSLGWHTSNSTGSRPSDVRNDTAHVVGAGCDMALATGGSWDGPRNSTCGNATGTLQFTSNSTDPELLNSLANISLGAPGPSGGVAAPVAGRAMFRWVTTPAFGAAPNLNASASCSTPAGLLADCPSVPAVGVVNGSTVLTWNWSTSAGHTAMGTGDTWAASLDLVATQGPSNASPLDVCAAPGCPLGENFSSVLGFSGVDFAVGGAQVELTESFPLVNVSIASPANLTASLSAPVTAADAPAALEFSISTAGGYPPFTTQWRFGDGTAESGGGALAVNHTYLGAGIYAVRADVTDSRGAVAHVLTWVVVEPALQAMVNASTEAGTAPLFVGFTAQVQGGEPPYAVEWNFGIGGSVNGTNISYDFGTPGAYEVQVRVTDALDGNFNATVPVAVGPAVAVAPVPPLSVNGSAVTLGGTGCGDSSYRFAFSALGSGGFAPYTYVWKFGDGAVGGGSLVDHTFRGSVPQPIATVTVTDSNGTTATETVVHGPTPAAQPTCPAAALGSAIPPTELEIGALGLAIGATVAAVVMLRRD